MSEVFELTTNEWIAAWVVAALVFCVFLGTCLRLVELEFRQAEEAYLRQESLFLECLRAARRSHEAATSVPKVCEGCRFLHGQEMIVCAVHPLGWQNDDSPCPDREGGGTTKV